jgi:CDP-paratose 2-epimerase
VVHTVAPPSHDWAASDPQTDLTINANGTLNLFDATLRHAPTATIIFCSANKVYGDLPNQLPLVELEYHSGIDTTMAIEASTHSLFGVSKTAADPLVQEYGRYFGMPTAAFRGGDLTRPIHASAMLHGFLSYLMRCTIAGMSYPVFGYDGNRFATTSIPPISSPGSMPSIARLGQVPSTTLVAAKEQLLDARAIALCEAIAGTQLNWHLSDDNEIGDHRWWISALEAFP